MMPLTLADRHQGNTFHWLNKPGGFPDRADFANLPQSEAKTHSPTKKETEAVSG